MPPDRWTLYPGRSRLPDAASPDVRGRSYSIAAQAFLTVPADGGVLIAHGDRHSGYALRVENGLLVHDYAHAGRRTTLVGTRPVPLGVWTSLELRVTRVGPAGEVRLLLDGQPAGEGQLPALARARTGYTGVDVGCDRGLPVGSYLAPARFTGLLRRVVVIGEADQWLDEVASMEAEGATG